MSDAHCLLSVPGLWLGIVIAHITRHSKVLYNIWNLLSSVYLYSIPTSIRPHAGAFGPA